MIQFLTTGAVGDKISQLFFEDGIGIIFFGGLIIVGDDLFPQFRIG